MSRPQENHQISIFPPYWRWTAIKLSSQFIPAGPASKYFKTNVIGNVFTQLQMHHFGLFLKSQACLILIRTVIYCCAGCFLMPLQIYDTILILDLNIFLSSLHEAPAVSAIFDIFLFDIYIFTKSRDPVFSGLGEPKIVRWIYFYSLSQTK